jgi:hypothetical protein
LGHWPKANDQVGLARSSPATQAGWVQPGHMGRAGPCPKNTNSSKKIISKKICDFSIFLLYFDQYWFVFLYFKDTNSVLKYLVFVKTLKFFFVFMHTAKSLKNKRKKYHIVFSYNKENFKNMY